MAKDQQTQETQGDDLTALLQEAAAQLSKAATDRANRDTILKDVEGLLSRISLHDAPELAESPVVQAFAKAMGFGDLKPGEVRGRGTLAEREREWTYEDMAKLDYRTFTPNETMILTVNGVPLKVWADVENHVPYPYYDRYVEIKRARAEAKKNEAFLLGHSDVQPHPDWRSPEGNEVAAYSRLGRLYGVRGGSITTGIIREDEGAANAES